jgi:hypothetical protein
MKIDCPSRGGNRVYKQLQKMQNTINNTKTNETRLQEELYYIAVLTSSNKNINSAIDSTDGASLHELKKKDIKITHDYESFKRQFEKFRELISSDRNLRK